MENITQKTIKDELAKVQKSIKEHGGTVQVINAQMKKLSANRNAELVELARLNGEERALKRLLSTPEGKEKK